MEFTRGLMSISSRIILINPEDKILLGHRQNTKYANGKWMLPGGVTDPGETARQSIIREAAEELSVVLHENDLNFVGTVHWYKASHNSDGATFNWSTRHWSYTDPKITQPTNNEPVKCREIAWFSGDDVAKMAANDEIESTTLGILEEFFKGNMGAYVECDWPA